MNTPDILAVLIQRCVAATKSSQGVISLTTEDLGQWSEQARLPLERLLDELAIEVARLFHRHEITYRVGDLMMNNLFFAATDSTIVWGDVFQSIYDAFDAGEYYHEEERNREPHEDYTRPTIAQILTKLEMP